MTPDDERRIVDAADTINAISSGACIGFLIFIAFVIYVVVMNWFG